MEDWFQQDLNSVPPIHVLQPITAKLKDYYNDKDEEARKNARSEWWKIFDRLQCTLRAAARCALKDGVYSEGEMRKYFYSGESCYFNTSKNGLYNAIFSSSQISTCSKLISLRPLLD